MMKKPIMACTAALLCIAVSPVCAADGGLTINGYVVSPPCVVSADGLDVVDIPAALTSAFGHTAGGTVDSGSAITIKLEGCTLGRTRAHARFYGGSAHESGDYLEHSGGPGATGYGLVLYDRLGVHRLTTILGHPSNELSSDNATLLSTGVTYLHYKIKYIAIADHGSRVAGPIAASVQFDMDYE